MWVKSSYVSIVVRNMYWSVSSCDVLMMIKVVEMKLSM
jgi:hypothetical protein